MKNIIFIFLILFTLKAHALQDLYSFSDPHEQQRFFELTHQLRCLVCQNQNISDSNAPLANDLRNQIYTQLQQGQSDQEIIDYLVSRYGDFILYKPPFATATMLLWMGPFLVLISGIIYLLTYLKRTTLYKKVLE